MYIENLKDNELRVIRLLSEGADNTMISKIIGTNMRYVSHIITSIKEKTHSNTTIEAVSKIITEQLKKH